MSATLFSRESQAHTLHHKIIIFFIIVVLLIARPMLEWSYANYKTSTKAYTDVVSEHDLKTTEQKTILKEVELLSSVKSQIQKNSVVQCYNTNCQTLPEWVREEPTKTIFKWYLQLQQTISDRFTVDQKKVLSYLNDFLIKWSNGTATAQIKEIIFGTPKVLSLEDLQAIPMSVTVTFWDKNGLLSFLRNIETLISPTYPMLAKVDSVSYDVVKAATEQDVQVAMTLYMMKTTPIETWTWAK